MPTPIPGLDLERKVEELQCAADIFVAQQALDCKIAELNGIKASCIAQETKEAVKILKEKASQVRLYQILLFKITCQFSLLPRQQNAPHLLTNDKPIAGTS